MGVFSLDRLRWFVVGAGVSGILALSAMAWQWPALLLVFAISASAGFSALCFDQVRLLRRRVDHANAAMGAFIRGEFDARIVYIRGLDGFGKLQHRINNLLDIVDLASRREEAAVNTGDDGDYIAKISASRLHNHLTASLKPPVLEIPPQLNVNPLLLQLEELRRTADHVHAVSHELVHRADQPAASPARGHAPKLSHTIRKTVDHTRNAPLTVKTLHTACEQLQTITATLERLAERGDILALNMAISAAHAGGDERITAAVSSVRLLAEQTREARDEVAHTVQQITGAAQAAMRLIYDIAGLIHQVNETYIAAGQDGAASPEDSRVLFLAEAKQALAAADTLRAQTERLGAGIRQMNEAA